MIVLSQIINGLILGTIYILMALGLSLIRGTMGILNFAHGVLFTLGAYFTVKLALLTNFWVAIIIGPVLVGFVGMFIQRFFMRRLQGKHELFGLLLTFGMAYIIEDIIKITWGVGGQPFNIPPVLSGFVDFGFLVYPTYRLFILGVTTLLLVALYIFLNKTKAGLIIKAGSRDLTMVALLGIPVQKVFTLVFGLGTMLAGIAGALAAPMWGVQPTMGNKILIPAFVVITLGGMGSLIGAVAGGLIIGVAVSMAILIQPFFSDLIIYVIMVIVLLVRPRGLFGEVTEAFE
ncbi:MAG: branched-chain amino acid ABC transporter permease [Rectinemataceae bacterium]|nr:branched-chain amino acid ABC transporter permease [Rectinemataceae bacterium]